MGPVKTAPQLHRALRRLEPVLRVSRPLFSRLCVWPPDVVVVDHHDSYTWNLVHLVAAVTGALPTVVQHDEVSAAEVLALATWCSRPAPATRPTPRTSPSAARCCARATRPVLGVCLGMQGLVTAYGGTVGRVAPAHGEVAVGEPRRAGGLRRAADARSPPCATTRWRR